MGMAYRLREASPADVAAIGRLRESVGWAAAEWYLRQLLAAGGILVVAEAADGQILATGGGIVFPPVGWVANMVVSPWHQGAGLGRAIFDHITAWLEQRGATRLELEATAAGRPLYERSGFTADWDSISAVRVEPLAPVVPDAAVAPLAGGDWAGVAALDFAATGSDRLRLLRRLGADPVVRLSLVLRGDAGGVRAYGMLRDDRLGPLVADSPMAACRLARVLLASCEPGFRVAAGHPSTAPFWRELGFAIEPFDTRMSRGSLVRARREMVFAMVNAGVG